MKKNYKTLWNGTLAKVIELGIDMLFVVGSLITVVEFQWYFDTRYFLPLTEIFSWYQDDLPFLAAYTLIAGIFFLVYKTSVIRKNLSKVIPGIFLSLLISNLILMLFSFILGVKFVFSPPYTAFLILFLQALVYIPYKWLLSKLFRKYNTLDILIYGPKEEVLGLLKEFLIIDQKNIRVKYLVFHEDNKKNQLNEAIYKYIDKVQEVYITENLNTDVKNSIVTYASFEQYKDVYVIPKTYEILLSGSQYDQVDDSLVFRAKTMHLSLEQRFVKRTFDILISAIGLVVAFIPMLVVALGIKIQDGGPVFYKQKRFKRDNKPFYILKFRSMKWKQTEAEQQMLATTKDPRITKFGRFIRATRLDELPQLINVFRGDMSLVGPRPFMESVVEKAMSEDKTFVYRFNVKPGVAGLAQVYGRYDTSDLAKLRYDLLYVRKYSVLLDIKIILLTIKTILSKEAALGRDDITLEKHLSLVGFKIDEVEKIDNLEIKEIVKK